MSGSYLQKLNPEQRRAVEYGFADDTLTGCGPLLVIAGAGSGKTNTLAHRVAHMVVKGVDPSRILLLTFSRRAAAEMSGRVERIVANALGAGAGVSAASFPWAGTFHSIGNRILREYAELIGLKPSFTIQDAEDAADLMNLMRHELGFSDLNGGTFPMKQSCWKIYSFSINAQLPLETVLKEAFPRFQQWEGELRTLFGAYVQAKQDANVLDYDDLLQYWADMAIEPQLMADVASRFDQILVDEYQDTNRLQARILFGMKPDGQGLTVVGDDAQSIYAFRAATVRNILDFPAEFNPPAHVVTLEQNYRSVQPILRASNAVIELASERFTKNLRSERNGGGPPLLVSVQDDSAQARYVVEQILQNREAGVELKKQAALFRASHHSAALELELTRRKIPFVKFGGQKFLESAHIKDVLAFLRWVENPRDRVAGFRAIKLIPGVGPKTADYILKCLNLTSPLISFSNLHLPPRCEREWQAFRAVVQQISEGKVRWPEDLECIRLWYDPQLRRLHDDADVRASDLVQLVQMAAGYGSRERFLAEMTLDPPDATSGQAGLQALEDDYFVLSTIHSAKGQEWHAVFLLSAIEGCIPSGRATSTTEEIEEERRLLYVAMTRARDQLHLIVPLRCYAQQQATYGDHHVYAGRTRFIPDTLLSAFEPKSWHSEGGLVPAVPLARGVQLDVGARARAQWR